MNEFNLVGKVMSLSQNEKGCEIKLEVFRDFNFYDSKRVDLITVLLPVYITEVFTTGSVIFVKGQIIEEGGCLKLIAKKAFQIKWENRSSRHKS